MSGTMPDPPATSRSGPPIAASQTRVAADRSAQFQPVTDTQFLREVGRHFPVIESFDSEGHTMVFLRWRGDRIAALGLVAVFSGEAHIRVLPRLMPHPAGQHEGDALRARRFRPRGDHLAELPGQSPQ